MDDGDARTDLADLGFTGAAEIDGLWHGQLTVRPKLLRIYEYESLDVLSDDEDQVVAVDSPVTEAERFFNDILESQDDETSIAALLYLQGGLPHEVDALLTRGTFDGQDGHLFT